MKKGILAVVFITASLPLASYVLAAAAPEAAKGALATAEDELPAARLNPTGRTYEVEVPLTVDGARLGDIAIKITADEKLFVDAKLLKIYLGKIMKEEVLTSVLAVPPEEATQVAGGATVVGKKTAGAPNSSVLQLASQQEKAPEPGQLGQEARSYLSLEVIKQRGVAISYDPLALELQVEPTVDQRPTGHLSLEPHGEPESQVLEQPAYVSAYLNMRMAASYVSQSSSGSTGVEAPSFDFDGAMRIGPVVLESEGTFYTGDSKASRKPISRIMSSIEGARGSSMTCRKKRSDFVWAMSRL